MNELVFIPGLGFRPADGKMLVTPVTVERGEWTLIIDKFIAGPERSELRYRLSGPGPEVVADPPSRPAWSQDPIRLREQGAVLASTPEGDRGGGGHGFSFGPPISQWVMRNVTFPPLSLETVQVDVILESPPDRWQVTLDLTPVKVLGITARPLSVSDAHHGVVITVHAVARGESMTALDVLTALDPTPQPRFMRSLGRHQMRRPGDASQFSLTDDLGNSLGEFACVRDAVTDGRELHEVLVFPALNPGATAATLTIPDIHLAEVSGSPITLPIPSEMDIELGGFAAHARITRATTFRGSTVRVQLDDGDRQPDRRLLYAEFPQVDGARGGVGWQKEPEPGDPVDTEDPSGSARQITLQTPVVRLHGPWRFGVPLR